MNITTRRPILAHRKLAQATVLSLFFYLRPIHSIACGFAVKAARCSLPQREAWRHDRNTNWRILRHGCKVEGDVPVHLGHIRLGALTALAMATALSGCDAGVKPFSMPADFFGRSGGYTYSDIGEKRQDRPVTANDLIQENGSCPAPPAAPQSPPAANNPGAEPAAAPESDSLLGGGIALGMSECEVVYRAGQPSAVQIGRNPNGDRTALLTFNSGPRLGVYHFERGRLMQMDRTGDPSLPPQQTKKKKNSAKSQKKDNPT